jgi:hypothetical protein
MARARNIKPGFFTNEDLVELDFATRLLFAGLWTVADKAGRLEDRPKKIKIDVFPADDVDIESMLSALAGRGFIQRYAACGKAYIQIVAWEKHQKPHHTERESVIPPPDNGVLTVKEPLEQEAAPSQDRGNRPDSLIPDSGFTDSSVPNGTGGKPPKLTDPKEIIFGYGLSLLVNASVPEKQARSFLGGRVKEYEEGPVIDALRDCARAKPLQPLEWLAAALPPKATGRKANAQEALEEANRAVAARFLENSNAAH